MKSTVSWYQTLAWTFFLRQAATILTLMVLMLWVAYSEAERGARNTANASLSAGGYVLERALEQQGRSLDAGLEVFTEYSGNVALIERTLDSRSATSLTDTLVENLPRLGAEIALVVKPDGGLLACTAPGARPTLPDAGIVQMALAPDEAKAEGHPGPFYRGFLRLDWGERPGVYHVVARPLKSPGGRSLGAMLVGLRLDDRTAADLRRLAIAGPQKGDPSPHLAILSQFKTLGTTFPEAESMDRLLSRDPAVLAVRAQVLDGQRSPVLPIRVNGVACLGMISPLRGVNALDLEMAEVLLMPMEPLLAPFRNLQKGILIVGIAGLVAALGLSLHSARKVTAPLKALAEASEDLARGEQPPTLDIATTPDEVGILTRNFKSMLAELQAKDDLVSLLEATRRGLGSPIPKLLPPFPKPSFVPEPDTTRAKAVPMVVPNLPEEEILPPSLQKGEIFASRYRVETLLGSGGMGVVLKVRDLQLDEDVALKIVRTGLASNPEFLDLLKREIRLARRITHRYVLRTHDFGECDGLPYVTMEYLKGITLHGLLDGRGRLPLPLVLRIVRQVAEGLEAAHAVGVAHRDIKPANVLFDVRGDAKIMDFGLAAPVAAAAESGQLIGSPRYMAPEQIRGDRVDARTDLYALGVMLFELCAGFPPFDHPSVNALLAMHLDTPAPSLSRTLPELSPDLEALVNRLLAKRPEDRLQSAAEVAEILKLLATGGGSSRF